MLISTVNSSSDSLSSSLSVSVQLRSFESTSELTDLLASPVSPDTEDTSPTSMEAGCFSSTTVIGLRQNCKRKIRQLMKIAWKLHNEKLVIEAELEEMNAVWESFLGFSVFEPGEEVALLDDICETEAEAHLHSRTGSDHDVHVQVQMHAQRLRDEMQAVCQQFNELMECENECVNVVEELVDNIVGSVQRYYKAATGVQESLAAIMRSCAVKNKYLKIAPSTQSLLRRIINTEKLITQNMSPSEVRTNLLSLLDLDARARRLAAVTSLVASTLEFRHWTESEVQKLAALCNSMDQCFTKYLNIASQLTAHAVNQNLPVDLHTPSGMLQMYIQSPPQHGHGHAQCQCVGLCSWLTPPDVDQMQIHQEQQLQQSVMHKHRRHNHNHTNRSNHHIHNPHHQHHNHNHAHHHFHESGIAHNLAHRLQLSN